VSVENSRKGVRGKLKIQGKRLIAPAPPLRFAFIWCGRHQTSV